MDKSRRQILSGRSKIHLPYCGIKWWSCLAGIPITSLPGCLCFLAAFDSIVGLSIKV